MFLFYGGKGNAKDFRGGGAVHVFAVGEGAAQVLVAREVRHDAQLDLRVVGRDDLRAGRGAEAFADAAARGGADRAVLQVGLVGREASRDRGHLRVGGMHAAGGRVDASRQLVGVGRFQLRERAVLEDQLGE